MRLIITSILYVLSLVLVASAAPLVNDISVVPIQGVNKVQDPKLLSLPAPLWVDTELSAGSAISHAVPTGARYMLISATANTYVRFGGTAAVPAGAKTDGTGAFLNPGLLVVQGQTTVSVIAATGTVITFAFYK